MLSKFLVHELNVIRHAIPITKYFILISLTILECKFHIKTKLSRCGQTKYIIRLHRVVGAHGRLRIVGGLFVEEK